MGIAAIEQGADGATARTGKSRQPQHLLRNLFWFALCAVRAGSLRLGNPVEAAREWPSVLLAHEQPAQDEQQEHEGMKPEQ
jgi:hypothetical protein